MKTVLSSQNCYINCHIFRPKMSYVHIIYDTILGWDLCKALKKMNYFRVLCMQGRPVYVVGWLRDVANSDKYI